MSGSRDHYSYSIAGMNFYSTVGFKTCGVCKRQRKSKGGKVNKLCRGFACAECIEKHEGRAHGQSDANLHTTA